MKKRVASFILPDDLELDDLEAFARKHNMQVWHSHTLRYLFGVLNQIRGELLQNHPVQAYNLLDDAQTELKKLTDEQPVSLPHEG
jgi:hypothetical protein